MQCYRFEACTFTNKYLNLLKINFEKYYGECKSMIMRRFLLSVFNFAIIDEVNGDCEITPLQRYVKLMQDITHTQFIEDSDFRQDMMSYMFNIKNSDGDQAFNDRVISNAINTYNEFVQCFAKMLDIQRNSAFKQVKNPVNITNLLVILEQTWFPYINYLRAGYDYICKFRSKKKPDEKPIKVKEEKEEEKEEEDEEEEKEEEDDEEEKEEEDYEDDEDDEDTDESGDE